MQMCPECGNYYDESESCKCPFCNSADDREILHIVYDSDLRQALSLSSKEYEEFKKTHPEYH